MNGKVSKNIRLRNHKGGEAETWYTCLGHMPLYKLSQWFFYSGRSRTLVTMATYFFHRLIMGKV